MQFSYIVFVNSSKPVFNLFHINPRIGYRSNGILNDARKQNLCKFDKNSLFISNETNASLKLISSSVSSKIGNFYFGQNYRMLLLGSSMGYNLMNFYFLLVCTCAYVFYKIFYYYIENSTTIILENTFSNSSR